MFNLVTKLAICWSEFQLSSQRLFVIFIEGMMTLTSVKNDDTEMYVNNVTNVCEIM